MNRLPALHASLFAALVLLLCASALLRARSFHARPDEQLLSGELSHAFESHYDAVFPVKTFGINLWAAIDYLLFDEGRSGVVLGADHWLYTDEEFKLENEPEARITENLARLQQVRDALAQKQIRLLVAVVPSKARVYPEFVGAHPPPALHQALYARFAAALQRAQVPSADLLGPLVDGKREAPTYLRTDTHWTPYGARLAAQAIGAAAVAQGLVPAAPPATFHAERSGREFYRGDLFKFLPLDPYFGWLLPPGEMLDRVHTEAAGEGSLLGDAATPQIALIGTSYSANPLWDFPGALQAALGQPVGNYARNGTGPFAPMQQYLDSADLRAAPPKLVIWEFPERYLPTAQPDANSPPPSS